MTITTKRVMALPLVILLCTFIGTNNVADAADGVLTHCAAEVRNCVLSNNGGVLQFTVNKISARTSDIIVPNLALNKALGQASLKLTTEFGTVDETTETADDREWTLKFSDGLPGKMKIAAREGVVIHELNWPESTKSNSKREICIHLGTDQSWYSSFEQKTQHWPMDLSKKIDSYPLNSIPLDTSSEIEFVVEHLLFSSKGFAIQLDRNSPLWFRIVPSDTDPLVCVTSKKGYPYSDNADLSYAEIKLSIYTGTNIRDVYEAVSNRLPNIPKPADIPSDFMFVNPIWSIIPGRGSFFSSGELNQDKVVKFLDELNDHLYQNNMLLLETDWQVESPFLTFNQTKFLNPKKMMSDIHAKGYKLNLLVHPFVKSDSSDYTDHKGLFVMDKSKTDGLMIRNGPYKDRYIVDFSNFDAADWFKGKLDKLKTDFDVDSFVFNPIFFSDNPFSLSNSFTQNVPVKLGEEYAKLAGKMGGLSAVHDGHHTQGLSIFTQMTDRASEWSYEKGLKSLIPTALAMSIGGYSYIMPDVVGGRTEEKPNNELYIRWAQAVTFFPTMQFAVPPWDYDQKTEDLVKELVTLHGSYQKLYVELARKRSKDGTPIIRPMWFVAPNEEKSFKIDDQFMLGDDLLVAPVLEPAKSVRTVFLPEGDWQNAQDKTVQKGPGIVQVRAPIEVLPYFTRVVT